MAEDKKIPTGRIGRLARLAVAGVRTGASVVLDRDGSATARAAAEALGNLRGVAAKVGQMMSYVDGMAPAAHAQHYESAMKVLRAAAPQSPFDDVKRVLEEDLRQPLDRAFAEFDRQPLASASIGQVHRARLPNGLEVAVKVQHPGVAQAMEADLASTGVLEVLAGAMGGKRVNSAGMFEELRTRLREELDYHREANHQTRFAAIHQGDARVVVPAVHHSHSAARVLTSTFVRGVGFEEACGAPLEDRQAWARTLWRYVFRGNLVHGIFNADPHPGNYLFHDDGRVTFLDFGCVQPISPARVRLSRMMHRAGGARDESAFAPLARDYAGTRPGRYDVMATQFIRLCFEPVFGSPFHITRDYSGRLFTTLTGMANASRTMADHEVTPMPDGVLFLNRMNFGFYSVLARLNVVVDYAAEDRTFLPGDDSDLGG